MGGNGNGLLIPARFLVTIGHLVAIIMIQSTMVRFLGHVIVETRRQGLFLRRIYRDEGEWEWV